MEITTKGHIVALIGYAVGIITAGISGAEVWQVIIAASALAIVFIAIFPGTTE